MDGHTVDRCWAKHGKPQARKVAAVEESATPPSTLRNKTEPPKITTLRNCCSVVALVDRADGVFHEVKINGSEYQAMLDSGSMVSIIRDDVVRKLGLEIDRNGLSLTCADNRSLRCLGQVKISFEMRIKDVIKKLEADFAVVENLCVPVLLGVELLGWLKIQVRLSDGNVSYEDAVVRESRANGVRTAEDVSLPGRSQTIVSAIVAKAESQVVETETFNFCDQIVVGNSISAVDHANRISCLIANLGGTPVLVPAGTQIAGFRPHNDLPENRSTSDHSVNAIIEIVESGETVNVGDELDEIQIEELRDLLKRNLDVFSIEGKIGETGLIEHDIVLTENAEPVVERLRRRPLTHKIETSKQIEGMLRDQIIERSESPWASAYVLVKKKSGEMRLCIDFRKLNEKTKKTSYPLPNIDDCLEPLNGNRFFSQLDLASGYWQIKLSERAKELTAFRTEDGLFHFRRMPFGLCNAPASFQRLVNALFGGLKGMHLQVFIDDICVATPTWSEHLFMLEKVFSLLRDANLTLKANKCTFGAAKVIFLGHELSKDGIRQDPNRLKALLQLPPPTDRAGVRRIIGMFNYYRKFVYNFASLAEPITKLMKDSIPFVWGNDQKVAFKQIKKELCRNQALSTFNHVDPVALKTDASKAGIAGILLQRHGLPNNDDWKIITCCSRQISETERNYGASDLEGLAIVYCVTKLRAYLLGRHFTIITDHCALCALRDKMPNSPRLRRWAILLSEYDFTIVYTKGGLHRDVDCLSRAPVDNAVDPYLDDKVRVIKRVIDPISIVVGSIPIARDLAEWRRLSDLDEDAKEHFEKARKRQRGYKIFNGLLYLGNRLFVPKPMRIDLMAEAHADNPACHGGFRATIERLSIYWWPSMADDVRDYVNACHLCQARKAERRLPTGTMHSFDAYEPLQLVAFDALGPLPASIKERKYVIVGIDSFTRFVDAKATKDVRGETFARYLQQYIGRFGIPENILTDNAPTFCNMEVTRLSEKFKFGLRQSTPHHHEGNAVVERVIQSLQEKLSLLTHDPASSVDWEACLPNAVLSLNTTIHSTTGFSPFELLFGCRHPLRSDNTSELRTPVSMFAELRKLRSERMRSEAISRQADARATASSYFNSSRRENEFAVGDLVLARVMGRRAKLENRYQGPYRVTSKSNDVYTIEAITGRAEKLQRHVSDLKAYIVRQTDIRDNHLRNDRPDDGANDLEQRTPPPRNPRNRPEESSRASSDFIASNMDRGVVLLLLLSVSPSSSIIFEEVPPIVWQPTRVYVSPGPTRVSLEVRFINPCHVLGQFQVQPVYLPEVRTAVNQCNAVFNEQLLGRLKNILQLQLNAPSVKVPINVGGKTSNGLSQTLKLQETSSIEISQLRSAAQQQTQKQQQHLNQVGRPVLIRKRREIVSFLCGAVACNVIETVVDKLWHGNSEAELDEREHVLEHKLNDLSENLNFTMIELLAQTRALALQQELVEHAIHRIDTIIYSFPQLAVVTASLVAKMHLLGAYIEKLRTSFRARRPDLETMATLFNIDSILDVDPDSIEGRSVSITTPAPNALRVAFTARMQSTDTLVYRVRAAKHWVNLLTSEPELREYRGPPAVLSNATSHCIQGIREPQDTYITGQCRRANHTDPRLIHGWETVKKGDPRSFKQETETLEAWPYVFIYCYPTNISIQGGITPCPPYTFKLDAGEAWSTDSFEYSPNAIERVETNKIMPSIVEVQQIHFPNSSFTVSKALAIEKMREMQERIDNLKDNNVIFENSHGSLSYKQTSWILLTLIGFIGIICICKILCSARGIMTSSKKSSHLARNSRSYSIPSEYRSRMTRVIYEPAREQIRLVPVRERSNQLAIECA